MLALSAGTASAAAATAISQLPTEAPIINKLYVPISLTVTCSPSDFMGFPGSLSVTIRQVVHGKEIAHGSSWNSITCDDTPHDYTVSVFPDISSPFMGSQSPPFKKGDAVISATVSSFFPEVVTAGPQSIRLK